MFRAEKQKCQNLVAAIGDGDVDAAFGLLDAGADPNLGVDGSFPLHHAAQKGYLILAKSLLARGALVDQKNHRDWTPLCYAAEWDHGEVCGVLIAAGADIDHMTPEGYRPIHYAVYEGNLELTRQLVAAGVAVDSPTRGDDRPLHIAAEYGHEAICCLLMDLCADPSLANGHGKTPFDRFPPESGELKSRLERFALGELLTGNGRDGDDASAVPALSL